MSIRNLFRGTVLLSGGTAIAQAIPIVSMPILARLYSPADFGVAAAYLAVVAMLSIAITGRYEMAINLPKQDGVAAALGLLALKLSILIGLLLFIPIYIFNEEIGKALGDVSVGRWLYLMPLAVVASGVFNVFQMWNSRKLNFKEMGMGYVQPSIFSAIFNIGFGLGKVHQGMLAGAVSAQLLSVFLMWRKLSAPVRSAYTSSRSMDTFTVARKYIRYPLMLVPAHMIGAGAQQIPLLVISAAYNSAIAGYFSVAYRLLILPAAIVGAPLGEVFRAQASQSLAEGRRIDRLFLLALAVSLVSGLILFCALSYVLPAVVDIVLGVAWQPVVVLGQLLLIPAYFQFVAASVDKIFLVTGSTRLELAIQVLRVMCFFPILGWVGLDVSIEVMVQWIAYAFSMFYLIVIALSAYVAIHVNRTRVV